MLDVVSDEEIPALKHREATREKARYRRGEWGVNVYNGNICSEAIEAHDRYKSD